jgi:putative membrane protein
MMGWYNNGWGAGSAGTLGMLLMVTFWASLVALALWGIARATRTHAAGGPGPESPRAILDRRFAAGEIDAEAYAQARRILEGQAPAPTAR